MQHAQSPFLPSVRKKRRVFFALLPLLLLFCFPGPLFARDVREDVRESEINLPFGGNVPESAARSTASALARHRVLEQAARHFAFPLPGILDSPEHRQALAYAVYTFSEQAKSGRRKCFVRVRQATPPRTVEQRLRKILVEPDMLQLRVAMLEREKALAGRAARLIEEAAVLRSKNGPNADAPLKEDILRPAGRLDALRLFSMALQEDEQAADPLHIAALLEGAVALDPDYPPLLCALGEALLRLDRPQDALERLNKALAGDNPPARALYARGLVYLRLQLPALAESDLNAALGRRPAPAAWLRARGALYMLQGKTALMCEDFFQACAAGDCEGVALARERGLCLPPARE